jgi:molybdopterin/thiamine biosynthesis adenylyltransferase
LCDDDAVDRSNLHRQILFRDTDVGTQKLDAAERSLRAIRPELRIRRHAHRLVPESALELVAGYDIVLEGSDNFATKFLAADACALARVPIVQASAVRWIGTVLAVSPSGKPCYRCLFEDLPSDGAPGCAEAGVIGPVVGFVAAQQVDLALSFLDGDESVFGLLVTFDGRSDELRRRKIAQRPDCPLCSREARIHRVDAQRYAPPACAG